MKQIDTIRAALEQAGEYIRSDLASERGAFEGHEGVSRIDEIKADLANNAAALAALAELEKACADAELAVHVQRGIADGYHDALKIWRQRAEQSEARLAAIDGAPTVAVVSECAAGLYVHQKLFGAQLAEPGTELIYRKAKDQP